jgi:hypothetical protein
MTTASPLSTYVHLVHGTWPYGLFGKHDPKRPCWFEPGGGLHGKLRGELRADIVLDPFLWSGKNGFFARTWAGMKLAERMGTVAAERPGVRQLVIAHSHGGSAAVLSMQFLAHTAAADTLKTCICLGTPFAYLIDQERLGDTGLTDAWGSIVASIFIISALIGGWFGQPLHYSSFALLTFVALIISVILHRLIDQLSASPPIGRPEILPHVDLIVLRAPRDEASLAIGAAQGARWIANMLYQSAGLLDRSWLATLFQFVAIVGILSLPLFFEIPYSVELERSSPVAPSIACLAAALIVTSVFHLGAQLLAGIATGLLNPLEWARSGIEVETVPLNHPCHVKTYSALYRDEYTDWDGKALSFRRRRLRHSELTNSPDAIRDIIAVIQAVDAGRTIALERGRSDDWLFG